MRAGPEVAVLSYHKIGPPPPGGWDTWYYVPTEVFARHLADLAAGGWAFIDLATFLAGLVDPAVLPDRSAFVTFDDAYRSTRTKALPVLERFACPGVVFAPCAYVGGWNDFDKGSEPPEPICSWDDLCALQAGGVSVQSHGLAHLAMSSLGSDEQARELRDSKAMLENTLGTKVEVHAFPFGDDGTEPLVMAAHLRATGYRAAFLYGGGPVRVSQAERYRLTRLAMGPDSDLKVMLDPSAREHPAEAD